MAFGGGKRVPALAVEKGVSCIVVAKEGGAGWNELAACWNRYVKVGQWLDASSTVTTRFREPLALSSSLAALGTPTAQCPRFSKTRSYLDSASNLYT